MATIVRKARGESDERLIAKFRKKIQAEKILSELKEREYYKPPSVKKRERLVALKRRRRRR